MVLPTDEEIALGRQMSQEIEQKVQLVRDPAVNRYVSDLGRQIVAAAHDKRPEIEFKFRVIDDPKTVNAFAIPGGWIYVYSGLLLNMTDGAELAAVLGHEVAHVTLRHVGQRLATAYGLQILAAVAFGEDPSTLEKLVTAVVANGYLLKFSRDQERAADEKGVRYEAQAGWDPRGFIQFFETLKSLEQGPQVPAWLSSHPLPQDRIDTVQALIRGLGTVPDREGKADYLDMRRSLEATPPAA